MEEISKVYPLESRALAHLFNGYLEGGASWVANADNYSGTGPTITFFKESQDKYTKQFQFRRLFVSFEAYLYQLFSDPEADANKDLLCFSPTTDSIIEHAADLLR